MFRIFQQIKLAKSYSSTNLLKSIKYNFANDQYRPKQCYYKVLNVSSDANFDEIKSSYLKLAKRYHPDANPDLQQTDKFKEITEAYTILSNVDKRAQYDVAQGLRSSWKYDQEENKFTNNEQYEQFLKEEQQKKKHLDEQAFDYFEKKYFGNKDFFKKNVIDDDEYELTMKLYKKHKEEVTEKKKDYIEFMSFSSNNYFVHKDVEKKAETENTTGNLLNEFKIPLLVLFLAMAGAGVFSGVNQKEQQKQSIQKTTIVKDGAGYRGNMTPVNIV
ncbi:hypothetical protein ABPG74_005983 [Tetrahymena malaccensis]